MGRARAHTHRKSSSWLPEEAGGAREDEAEAGGAREDDAEVGGAREDGVKVGEAEVDGAREDEVKVGEAEVGGARDDEAASLSAMSTQLQRGTLVETIGGVCVGQKKSDQLFAASRKRFTSALFDPQRRDRKSTRGLPPSLLSVVWPQLHNPLQRFIHSWTCRPRF